MGKIEELHERAWGIIANAGDIWDSDSPEAKEWREAAWAFERAERHARTTTDSEAKTPRSPAKEGEQVDG